MNSRKVLITAGGTIEKIDDVRSVTNQSTGLLGSLIADEFTDFGWEVTFLNARGSALPELLPTGGCIPVESVAELQAALENQLKTQKFDAIIHAMAVSDFTPTYTLTPKNLAENLAGKDITEQNILKAITEAGSRVGGGKIPSGQENLLIAFESTPKLIDMMKTFSPSSVLVGFKLLSGADKQELQEAAQSLIKTSGCDFVLANDLTGINSAGLHKAFLVDSGGIIEEAENKHDIAAIIYGSVSGKVG